MTLDRPAPPHVRLSEDPHDRVAEHRKDDAWLAEAWSRESTRVLVVAGTRIRPLGGEIVWVAPSQAPDGVRVLLGERDGVAWFALVADRALADDRSWVPLRGVLPALAGPQTSIAPLVLHALGIAEWLDATHFCPRCGGRLEARAAGHELVCLDCGRPQFPRSDPAVIMLVSHGEPGSAEERCLLGRQASWPEGRFSTLAGFCEPGETLEDAVRREVMEETGVQVGEVTWFGNQPWPLPSSLMLGFFARAETTDVHVDGVELAEARWLTRAELLEEVSEARMMMPGGISISHSLLEAWLGDSLPGGW